MGSRQTMTFTEVEGLGLTDWRWLHGALHAHYASGGFAAGLALVDRIGELAEAADHHPDVDLRYPYVRVTLVSHDAGGVTSRDVDLARQVSAAAAALGIPADPSRLALLEIGLDAVDEAAIEPFWRAVLGLDDGSGEALPPVWFQQTEPHDVPRQRFHLDVTVAPEVAQQRIDAALAAGGTLVSADRAPAFTVLADAEGNRACVCTAAGRD
ncbi:MAG TPA: 4a-hydroxytetrahydrobiopterin dehydratase [Nocardioides sp.]|uniref:4a-hydroxytetrahydrobiopterin dehydratase n=1 Tax=Nocardioides sp. TaxID=35761 RepID=UPI002E368DD5|nr:4a-hydroxytetrahydrobiopterin dehydratase [Nocardioides sp.]HEX3929176.1 4a-hydroxytetrahydrobiopterin dehydratase [Nocardioides sp.]